MQDGSLKVYKVWDKPMRLFHWINFLAIFGLIGVGTVILNASSLGVPDEGKILLKTTHVLIGYVFATNLLVRLIWAFFGNRHTSWRGILPCGAGYMAAVRDYISGLSGDNPRRYLGHNPLGRLSVTLLLLMLFTQASTGLILAGTDIFFPPLGNWITNWIAADGVDAASLVPYAKEMYDEQAYAAMREFRSPIITTHVYNFYGLIAMITIHIVSVIVSDVREGGGLISAMFTGRKVIEGQPVDDLDAEG